MFLFKPKKRYGELEKSLQDASFKVAELEQRIGVVQGIVVSMVEGVIVVGKDMRILSVNPTLETIFKVDRKDAEGRLFLEVIRNNDIAEIIEAVLEDKGIVQKELALSWPVQKTFQINASPIFEGRTVNGCLVVIHDISEIRRLERVRRDFVANISHELKTPLTSIKGFVETLIEGALEDKQHAKDFLRIINEHTDRLNNLINDLLALSYLESREVELKKEKTDLNRLVDEILSGFQAQINKKGVSVKNGLSASITIRIDKEKIRQVLINLIDNAIKFNKEKGSVRIYNEDSPGALKIIVKDSGLGIPEKDIPRIFERFYRVDKARSRELGGTGLGLSIVKHIVELHGGSVGVESTEGLGSKFWFILPK